MLPPVVDGGLVVVTSVTVVPAEVTTVVVFVVVVDPEGEIVVFVTSVVSCAPSVVVGDVNAGVVDFSVCIINITHFKPHKEGMCLFCRIVLLMPPVFTKM